jgi:hypothetical protein
MKIKLVFFGAVLPAFLLLASGQALAGDFSLTPQVGSLGLGLNAGCRINDYFKLRLNANFLGFSLERTIDEVRYNADLSFFTVGALADAHPFGGNFRVTGGLYYASLNMDVNARLEQGNSYKLGGHTYTGEQLGTWEGTATWKTLAPYLGIGWGSGAGTESGFSFHADLGALYVGSPKVRITPSDSARKAAAFMGYDMEEDVRAEESKARKSISKTSRFWPVLSLGVSYRF